MQIAILCNFVTLTINFIRMPISDILFLRFSAYFTKKRTAPPPQNDSRQMQRHEFLCIMHAYAMRCFAHSIGRFARPDRPVVGFFADLFKDVQPDKKRLCGDAFGFYDLYKECRGKHPGGAAVPPALPAPLKQRKSNIINALLYFKYPDKCCYTVLRRGYSPTCVYDPDIKSCFYYLPPFFYTISASHQEIFLYSTA